MSKPITDLIHHPYVPPPGFEAPQQGVFKAATVIFPSVAAMRSTKWKNKDAYTYGLHGTPTTFALEERIATLEGGRFCLLAPSGLAAIAMVSMALLRSGDEVLIPDNAYGPTKALAQGELAAWGISHQFYDAGNPDDLKSRIGPSTRLVWLEAPGSVTLEFPDLPLLAGICRAAGVMSALDNTWGAGIAFSAFDLGGGAGVDISVHALTKYPSGGGDVLMGSIVTRDEVVHERLKLTHMRMGLGVGGNDVETILRSLPSLAVRYRAQDQSARELSRWFVRRPEAALVLNPAIEGSPGHEHWRALCGTRDAAAGLFSVVFQTRYAPAQVDAFCEALKLFRLGYSWGGPVSLVVPYNLGSMRHSALGSPSYPGVLVRFSVGLEAVEDLRADLEQALRALC